jgi:L-lactate permease
MDSGQAPLDLWLWLLAVVPIALLLILLVRPRRKGIEAGPAAVFTAALVGLVVSAGGFVLPLAPRFLPATQTVEAEPDVGEQPG